MANTITGQKYIDNLGRDCIEIKCEGSCDEEWGTKKFDEINKSLEEQGYKLESVNQNGYYNGFYLPKFFTVIGIKEQMGE